MIINLKKVNMEQYEIYFMLMVGSPYFRGLILAQ